MDIRITFPYKVLKGLCHASDKPVSLDAAKNLVLKAIDPDQEKLSGIRAPFKTASLKQGPSSHTLCVLFNKNVPKALGQTIETFPDFLVKSLHSHASQIPATQPLLAEQLITIRCME